MNKLQAGLGRLERLEREATERPWRNVVPEDVSGKHDAALIVHARNALPELIEVARAGAKALRMIDHVGCIQNCHNGAIPIGPDPDGNVDAEQCQWCAERDELAEALDNLESKLPGGEK